MIDDLWKIQPTYTHKKHTTGPFFKVINYYIVKVWCAIGLSFCWNWPGHTFLASSGNASIQYNSLITTIKNLHLQTPSRNIWNRAISTRFEATQIWGLGIVKFVTSYIWLQGKHCNWFTTALHQYIKLFLSLSPPTKSGGDIGMVSVRQCVRPSVRPSGGSDHYLER